MLFPVLNRSWDGKHLAGKFICAGSILKISFVLCLEVTKKFVWWWWVEVDGGGWWFVVVGVEREVSD